MDVESKRVRFRVGVPQARASSILIASGHKLFAEAIGHALKAEGMDVVAIASTGAEALAGASRGAVATALIDVDLPDASGVDIGRELLQRHPGILVIAMSDPVDIKAVTDALDSGFAGFLSRAMDAQRLMLEIECSPAQSRDRSRRVRRAPEAPPPPHHDELDAEDHELVRLLQDGATAEEIGAALGMGTVDVLGRVWEVLSKMDNIDDEDGSKPGPRARKVGGYHYPPHFRIY
ncbi:MAG: response regulator [Actinomycetota bacterium]